MTEEYRRVTCLLAVIFIVVVIISINDASKECNYQYCYEKKTYGSEYCYDHTCHYSDCYVIKVAGEDYCYDHQVAYNNAQKKLEEEIARKPQCIIVGCEEKVEGASNYCYWHGCRNYNCGNPKIDGSDYCINHTCIEKDCFNRVDQKDTVCDDCNTKAINRKNATIYKQDNKSNKKTKIEKYSNPDCDDYDIYDDFMDDWDGYMPDGSDAEDYWEDW